MGVRWIVGIDGSPESDAALGWVLHESSDRDVDVDVVHVEHVPVPSRLIAAVTRLGRTGQDADASAQLLAATAELTAGREVRHIVVEGSPGRALVDAARDASLLVVGRHGAGGWHHALGSVSRYCVTHSPTPTVVVPANWTPGPIRKVVVGFDGSEHASAALRWTSEFCGSHVDVEALIALEVAPWLEEDIVHARLGDELQAEERRLRVLLDAADPSGRAHPHVVVRGARAALAHAGETADLVVVGAHGAGRVGTALLGSVSTWMLDGAPAPVVVVPAPEHETETSRKGTT